MAPKQFLRMIFLLAIYIFPEMSLLMSSLEPFALFLRSTDSRTGYLLKLVLIVLQIFDGSLSKDLDLEAGDSERSTVDSNV